MGHAPGEQCRSCPDGRYAHLAGSTECTRCAVGQIANAGHTSCEACPAGRFAEPGDRPKFFHCVACGAGRFAPNDGASECALCPGGQGPDDSRTGCTDCPPGRHSITDTDVPIPRYQVVTTPGATCASLGLHPITTALECQAAIIAENAANGHSGHDGSAPSIVDHSISPTGCHTSCFTSRNGHYCEYLNQAETDHGAGASSEDFPDVLFCLVEQSAPCLADADGG
jgi:hypothetical protein